MIDHELTDDEIADIRAAHERKGIIRVEARFIREVKPTVPSYTKGGIVDRLWQDQTWIACSDFQCLYLEWKIPGIGGIFRSKFEKDGVMYSDLKTFWDKVTKWQGRFELVAFEFQEGEKRFDKRGKTPCQLS